MSSLFHRPSDCVQAAPHKNTRGLIVPNTSSWIVTKLFSLVWARDASNDRRPFSRLFMWPTSFGVSRLNEDSLNLGLYVLRKWYNSSFSYLDVTIERSCLALFFSNVNRIASSSDSSDELRELEHTRPLL